MPRRPGALELRLGRDEAVGLIDWDFLHPAPRLDDVAYALRWFAPARSDELALEWHHFPVVPDRRARIDEFLAAYGDLPAFDHTEVIAARMEATIGIAPSLAEAGVEPQRTWRRRATSRSRRRRSLGEGVPPPAR